MRPHRRDAAAKFVSLAYKSKSVPLAYPCQVRRISLSCFQWEFGRARSNPRARRSCWLYSWGLPFFMFPLLFAVLTAGDGDLLQRLKNRDQRALAELYDTYGGM